jgi:hypothetical protein
MKIGPRESSLIAIAAIRKIGANNTAPVAAAANSNMRRIAKHHLRTVSIEGTVEDSDLVTARHFGISLGLAAAPDQPVDAIPDSQNGQSCASDRPWSAVYPVVTTATVAPSVTVVSIRQRW